jgi:hypothetical protein
LLVSPWITVVTRLAVYVGAMMGFVEEAITTPPVGPTSSGAGNSNPPGASGAAPAGAPPQTIVRRAMKAAVLGLTKRMYGPLDGKKNPTTRLE